MKPRVATAGVTRRVFGGASSRRMLHRLNRRHCLRDARVTFFSGMLRRAVCMALLLAAGGAAPAVAQTPDASMRIFRVGGTGIMCVRAPCPSWGVVAETSLPGERRGWPLWAGNGALPLRGPEAATRQIRAAWRARDCLRVEGRWMKDALEVRRVIGACNGR